VICFIRVLRFTTINVNLSTIAGVVEATGVCKYQIQKNNCLSENRK